jgi:tRNA (adenine57-N1/adenine58-N1)-methyltransferase
VPQPVSIVAEKLKVSERKREEKRLKQIQANREKKADQQAKVKVKEKKRKREKTEDELLNGTLADDPNQDKPGEGVIGTSQKRPRIQEDQEGQPEEMDMDAASSTISLSKAELSNDPISMPLEPPPASTSQIPVYMPSSSEAIASSSTSQGIPMPASISPAPSKPQLPIISSKINLSKALPEVRGHTSYLTFARLVPIPSSSSLPSTSSASASVSTTQSLESQIAGIGSDPLPAPEQDDQPT